ncbi:MAG TPA: biosynthetic-type acetolactate synthase large subunit [Gemmatimonadaceae bacterium]|nr:biosynthetic-type acetolactate synthase large subunit [Gemmatimonadaceae bacterium]
MTQVESRPVSRERSAAGKREHDEVRTGAQIMCEALIREGVDTLFGIPGGAIMPFYFALPEYAERLRHVLCRHEQGAGHAAEGYARATGRVGVCVGTSGPGATNLVTPIADAWMDSTPLVAITGQVSSAMLGKDAFQETDITGITTPITKHNYLVTRADDLAYVFREAFHLARSGRPGPVLIDVTKDAQQARAVPRWDPELRLPGYRPTYEGSRWQVRKAAELLAHAERPLIMAGNGVIQSGAATELRALAELLGIPVVTTLHGLGAFPQDHPLSLGMPGMHGWVHVNRAIQECDLLLNVGGRFDDRVTGRASSFAPRARVIHIDIDPSEIGKNVATAVPIVGDARRVLAALVRELRGHALDAHDLCQWLRHIRELQSEHEPRQTYRRRPSTALAPHDVYEALDRSLQSRGAYRVVTDVGQHQMWAAQLIDWRRPRTHITSGGSGTMGFAIPAALGVALACPDETVWVVVGDGGFQMTNQELTTLVQEGIRNVKVAIINNGYLGMVRQWQELFDGRRYSGTPLSGPDFALLAEAHGIRALTVDHARDVDSALSFAWSHDAPVVLDFRVEREANVFPMVPAGGSLGEMLVAEGAVREKAEGRKQKAGTARKQGTGNRKQELRRESVIPTQPEIHVDRTEHGSPLARE